MEQGQKYITGLKKLEITWLPDEGNFVWDAGPAYKIHICALQFNDGVFLGQVDYPACLVAGRVIEGVGIKMVVLDVEDGNTPLLIRLVSHYEGEPDRVYGMMYALSEVNGEVKIHATATASVLVQTPNNFEGQTIKQVFDKIAYLSKQVGQRNDLLNRMYTLQLETPNEQQREELEEYKQSFNSSALEEVFTVMDNMAEPDDE